MKRVENQDYYQILEVPYHASWGEIQKAYELAKTTYSKGAMASYSLFDFTERGRILDKIEEAYQVLSHPEKRRKYDHALERLIPECAPVPAHAEPLAPAPLLPPQVAGVAPSPQPPIPDVSPLPLPTPAFAAKTETLVVAPPVETTHAAVKTAAVENEMATGRTLKALREQQGISLSDIAEKTRINISYLEFMESNSYGSLPAPVYVIGYLKQYAKFVALDNVVIEAYMKGYQQWCDSPKQSARFR